MPQSQSVRHVSVDAPAKINLFLHVTGRRDDGYHLLESLVAFTEFGDRISVETADDISLSVEGPFAEGLTDAGADNLVLRAANVLRDAASIESGARIILQKQLPVSSGIGGGSADAAATLRALVTLWNANVSDGQLAELGLSLGADVPVCLNARTAIMSGVGEHIQNTDILPACAVVLVNALEPVSTPAVFGARSAEFSVSENWNSPVSFDEMIAVLEKRQNDLALAAQTVSPVIGDVLAALDADPGCALARLSGSGGTVFGLFARSSLAEAAVDRITSLHPDWWCVASTFRNDVPVVRAAR